MMADTLLNNLSPLPNWMRPILLVAGIYNIIAGLAMIVFYHEGFKALGLEKPEIVLPIQLIGILVGIFGLGYLLAAGNPRENRNIILLGFLSKLLGPLLACYYIIVGVLPVTLIPLLLVADVVYLVPFWIIYRRLLAEKRNVVQSGGIAECFSDRLAA